MNRIDPKNLLIVLLLGLFLWAVVDGTAAAAPEGGGGDKDNGLIAVTGQFGSGASVLYLLDSRTRHLSVYRVDGAGKNMELVAARDCTYDFYLQTYHDRSELPYLPMNLKKSWEKRGGRSSQPIPGATPDKGVGKPKVGPTIKPIGGGQGG